MSRLITQQQAAEYLGVTTRTIRNMVSRGTLTGYSIRGLRAIRLDADEVRGLTQVLPTVLQKPPTQPYVKKVRFGPRARIARPVIAADGSLVGSTPLSDAARAEARRAVEGADGGESR